MTIYQIISDEGVDLGTFRAETPRAAIEAMWRDEGWRVGQSDIEDFRHEVGWAGDRAKMELCRRALDGDPEARAECALAIREAYASRLTVRKVKR